MLLSGLLTERSQQQRYLLTPQAEFATFAYGTLEQERKGISPSWQTEVEALGRRFGFTLSGQPPSAAPVCRFSTNPLAPGRLWEYNAGGQGKAHILRLVHYHKFGYNG
jgi:hypothetical protein